LTDTEIWKSI